MAHGIGILALCLQREAALVSGTTGLDDGQRQRQAISVNDSAALQQGDGAKGKVESSIRTGAPPA